MQQNNHDSSIHRVMVRYTCNFSLRAIDTLRWVCKGLQPVKCVERFNCLISFIAAKVASLTASAIVSGLESYYHRYVEFSFHLRVIVRIRGADAMSHRRVASSVGILINFLLGRFFLLQDAYATLSKTTMPLRLCASTLASLNRMTAATAKYFPHLHIAIDVAVLVKAVF